MSNEFERLINRV